MTRIRTIAWVVWLDLLRRKDIYVLLILMGALLLSLASLDIFGLGGMVRYVADVGLLLSWVFAWVLSIHLSARELPQEEIRGTIYPLLARPIARLELLLGKWLGTWSAVCAATLLFYLLVAGVVAGMGGTLHPVALVQGFLLHAIAIGLLGAMALLFSTRMHHDAAATLSFAVSGALFLVVPRIPVLLVQARGFSGGALLALYHLMPHFELFDLRKRIVHAYGPASWGTCAALAAYGMLWIAFLLLMAWLAYRNKRFSRGAITG